jgi:hypothetical protein
MKNKNNNIDIKSLEINLFKASEIQDSDIILIKIDEKQRGQMNKDDIQQIYNEIKNLIKKDISIYFFPKSLSINTIKNHVLVVEDNKENIEKEVEKLEKDSDEKEANN